MGDENSGDLVARVGMSFHPHTRPDKKPSNNFGRKIIYDINGRMILYGVPAPYFPNKDCDRGSMSK
ncbi:MAG: hypothetical protein WC548_01875 [Candidatus Pacearchaeota archaeon]